jgi:hypothetical protein
MTSRGIGPGVRPQPFDVTRPERSDKSPEPRAQGSVLRRLKTDIQIRFVKTAYGGDLRIRSARGKSVDGTGLNGLAGNKRSGSEGAKDVLRQLIECRHCDWKEQIGEMSDVQLLQTYKNVKHNSAVLSAIAQTHGNPSELYDFARKIADTVTQAVRDRGMRADDIVPKPFDRLAEKNEGLVEILGRELLRPLASGDHDAGVVLKQLLRYGSSDDLWMQSVSRMEDEEIAQVLKNLRNNSVLFSAIAQTHGNPSALYDFVKGFAALFLAEAEKRGMPSEAIKQKDFDVTNEQNLALLQMLHSVDAASALSDAKKLEQIGTNVTVNLDKLMDFTNRHFATCTSEKFWSLRSVLGQSQLFGCAINLGHVQLLQERLARGGEITGEDLGILQRLLRDADGTIDFTHQDRIALIQIDKNNPEATLFEMLKVVAHHYLGERDLHEPVTNERNKGTLLNLQINLKDVQRTTENAKTYIELRHALEAALNFAIAPSDFNKYAIVRAFSENASAWEAPAPEQPMIFHP